MAAAESAVTHIVERERERERARSITARRSRASRRSTCAAQHLTLVRKHELLLNRSGTSRYTAEEAVTSYVLLQKYLVCWRCRIIWLKKPELNIRFDACLRVGTYLGAPKGTVPDADSSTGWCVHYTVVFLYSMPFLSWGDASAQFLHAAETRYRYSGTSRNPSLVAESMLCPDDSRLLLAVCWWKRA